MTAKGIHVATQELNEDGWFKSSFCGSGACVEVAIAGEAIRMRDGKAPSEPFLAFSRDSWAAFVSGVRSGEFDRA
jgi:hypothetical protein